MIRATAVAGNVGAGGAPAGAFERLRLARHELGRARARGTTDAGTDVGVALDGGGLRRGDVLEAGGRTVVVEQLPERVAVARPRGGPGAMAVVGHIIGNSHRPMSVAGGAVSFPIQADSELETFGALFSGVDGGVDLEAGEAVFVPQAGAGGHAH